MVEHGCEKTFYFERSVRQASFLAVQDEHKLDLVLALFEPDSGRECRLADAPARLPADGLADSYYMVLDDGVHFAVEAARVRESVANEEPPGMRFDVKLV